MKCRAAVQVSDARIEMREFDVPPEPPPGGAVLRVEVSGMCGTDVTQFSGGLARWKLYEYPAIMGHEPVGRLEQVSAEAEAAWGATVGDRVVVEPAVFCAACRFCTQRMPAFCTRRFVYGFESTSVAPSLWGSYGEYLVLRPGTRVHRLAESVPTQAAAMFNALAGGFDWGIRVAGTRPGDDVLIIGAGQRGLTTIIAAREAGARRIIVASRGGSPLRLDLARRLGATEIVTGPPEEVADAVREMTGGEGARRVFDFTPHAAAPVNAAIDSAAPGATLLLVGVKGMVEVPIVTDRIVQRGITVKGARGPDSWGYEQAVRILEAGRHPITEFHTHEFGIDRLETAIRTLAGHVEGEEALQITVTP